MGNYKSKVIKETYSQIEKQQYEELKDSALLERFAVSRSALSKDSYRPIYHFTSPECQLNDPNGLCFWKGKWHLFYQAYPSEDSRQHWGHAVSDDLVCWRDLPYAIYPDPEKCCYSGSIFIEDNRAIAMYHGTELGNMIAISDDDLLLNWTKIIDNAVIPMHKGHYRRIAMPYTVFDPCIWKDGDYYYSLSGGATYHESSGRKRRAFSLFKSSDLIKWKYMHEFVDNDTIDIFSHLGDDGACPYFWPIGKEKYILFCFSHMSGGQVMIGEYDKINKKFIPSSIHRANYGATEPGGVHAPSAYPCGDGSVVAIYNINHAKETPVYKGIMSLPRKYTLIDDDCLKIEPWKDIENLRMSNTHLENVQIQLNEEHIFEKMFGNAIEIDIKVEINNASLIELDVLRADNRSEYTRICFYPNKGFRLTTLSKKDNSKDSIISIDTSHSTTLNDVELRPPENMPVYLGNEKELNLRIFIDKSVVEVFVNSIACATVRVYPSSPNSNGISIKSLGDNIKIKSMDVYQMKQVIK